MTTKTVFDLIAGAAVVMATIDAHHAVSTDPKRWSFTDPNAKEPQKVPSVDEKIDELWAALKATEGRLAKLEAKKDPQT